MDTSPLTICHVSFPVPVGTTWPTLQYETDNRPPPSPLHFYGQQVGWGHGLVASSGLASG